MRGAELGRVQDTGLKAPTHLLTWGHCRECGPQCGPLCTGVRGGHGTEHERLCPGCCAAVRLGGLAQPCPTLVALVLTASRFSKHRLAWVWTSAPASWCSHPQAGFLPGELGLSSPGPLSPSGVKSSSQYYPSYPSNPRRRAADSGLGKLVLGAWVW